jgi:hypothetical protein
MDLVEGFCVSIPTKLCSVLLNEVLCGHIHALVEPRDGLCHELTERGDFSNGHVAPSTKFLHHIPSPNPHPLRRGDLLR